ncbi:unnamed protein product [Trichobilharzia regenti]|nr:unnamed protein product [Trichobilharzia regenti]
MRSEVDNYDEATSWNENVYVRTPSVNNLRVSRFRRTASKACLFNIITTIALIITALIALAYALSYYGIWNSRSHLDVVSIFCGQIKGVQQNKYVMSFLGIPYALPPIDENRFKPPLQLSSKELCQKAWDLSNITVVNTVYYAQHYKPPCLQLQPKSKHNEFIGSENCLYLNVHVPITNKKSTENLKPVIVILDGLFFMYNNEPKQPSTDTIYKTDAIHVTFNHRIGPFGFLPHPNKKTPNLGLHDQLLVLKWIRNNIVHFGGDPLNVILFGYGSGATCALTLLYSSISNHLFDKLWITAPGLSLSNITTDEVIHKTNQALNCQKEFNPNFCSSQKFQNSQNILNLWNWTIVEPWLIKTILSLPSIHDLNMPQTDKFINILINDDKFVSTDMWNKIAQSNIKPMVIGQTSHEVSVYPTPKTVPFWNKVFYKNYILKRLKRNAFNPSNQYYEELLSKSLSSLNCARLGDLLDVDDIQNIGDAVNNNDGDWFSSLMSLITDSRVTCPLTELVNQFTNSLTPVYQYYLTGTHRSFDPYSLRGFVPYAFHGWDAMLYLRTYETHSDFTDPTMHEFARSGVISSWHKSTKDMYDVNLIENDQLCKYVNIMKKRCDFWKLIFENNLFNFTWRF